MMRAIIGATFALLVALPADAEQVAYTLDPVHTQTLFSVDRFGYTTILGMFATSGGTVWLDEDRPETSKVDAWVETGSLWSSSAEREKFVTGKSWLDAIDNPKMTFKSSNVVRTGADTAEVTGDLTVFGQTHPVTFKTKLNRIGKDIVTGHRAAGFSLEGDISRKAFGNTTAGALIGDTVHIRIEALAVSEK